MDWSPSLHGTQPSSPAFHPIFHSSAVTFVFPPVIVSIQVGSILSAEVPLEIRCARPPTLQLRVARSHVSSGQAGPQSSLRLNAGSVTSVLPQFLARRPPSQGVWQCVRPASSPSFSPPFVPSSLAAVPRQSTQFPVPDRAVPAARDPGQAHRPLRFPFPSL